MELRSSELFDSPLTPEEAKIVDELIPIRTFERGTVLLRAGEVAREAYWNIKGLVRSYYLIDGEEKTVNFFAEGEAVASLSSYVNQVPADHYLECVEDTTLTVLRYDKEQELIEKVPVFESLCRVGVEQDFGKHQSALASYITKSPEQRYLHLLETRPELLQRVPQYHLASYLGVKPESLSRIRKRLTQKG